MLDLKAKNRHPPKEDGVIENLLKSNPAAFSDILKNKKEWGVQIIYTQIDRDKTSKPSFTHHYFNVDEGAYFYPASTVKMPAAILALQKLNHLSIPGLDKATTFITEAGTPEQTAVNGDSTTADGRATIAHYIKKIFLVSDNDAFNRLYEFLGQEYLNQSLHNLGYDSVQLLHRLQLSLTEEQNRRTNPVKFFDPSLKLLYQQPLVQSGLLYQPRINMMGKGYMSGDQLVHQPFDFQKRTASRFPSCILFYKAFFSPMPFLRRSAFN